MALTVENRRQISMEKTPEEVLKEREKRIFDAIQLKVPDRVPISAFGSFFSAKYYGFTCREVMYNRDKAEQSTLQFLREFEPDMGENPFMFTFLGAQLESIGYNRLAWAGHGLNDMSSYQYLERETMKEIEYDEYLFDPTDFVIRKVWPRIFDALKPFENLPSLQTVTDYMSVGTFIAFAEPAIQKALEAMVNTGKLVREAFDAAMIFNQKLAELGFPIIMGSAALVPFDYISDILRGTKGAMVDMRRIPEKLLAMIEKVYPMMTRMGLMAKWSGKKGVFIPLHKGLDGFMSTDQFKTFYWPWLKKMIEVFIAEDLIPMVLWEGHCDTRLELIGDIPKGKALYMFEGTNMFKAKEVLGDVVCLQGNVPLSLLVGGSPDDVKNYCRKLIDVVGKGGGFIMAPSTALDDAKPENVKAMFDVTKEYGAYK
jgi:uroporphyrinogen-III decarboxylase